MKKSLFVVLATLAGLLAATMAGPASPAVAATPGASYYVTAYDGTVYELVGTRARALTYDEWQSLGAPAPQPAATEYVRYPWSSSVSAVTFFGPDRADWVWKYISYAEFGRAGYPFVRTADWIAGSQFRQWATSPEIFVTDPGGVTHALTYDEWRRAQFPAFDRSSNAGYVRLSWDDTGTIAFMCDIAGGKGARVSWSEWLAAGTPSPAAVARTAGDRVYAWNDTTTRGAATASATLTYQGAVLERTLTTSAWQGLGAPSPSATGRVPSGDFRCQGGGTADADGVFTVATYPDTQQEVFSGTRFKDRSNWLVAHRTDLDLRFVVHTGDVVNWDTDAHEQYVNAKAALDPLRAAGIPFQLSIGNHDTLATGPGGGARDSKRTREYQRTTTTFNSFWSAADYGAVQGAYESGKVDNTYSVFSAEGARWLVLNLELWPRAGVLDWAEGVIRNNPDSNVIVQTHSFLNGAGDIDGAGNASTRYSYGDSSPQLVYDRLVAPYPNVKIVMSGHVGSATSKVITTAKGNKVAFVLQAIHSNTNNPTRLSEIDVPAGVISTRVFAPSDGAYLDVNTLTGLSFITQ